MDPNANLNELLGLASRILDFQNSETKGDANNAEQDIIRDAIRMAELATALNEWIVKGGFLPAKWSESSKIVSRPSRRK